MLPALYEIRNNRNVGHVGGDVDPNEMDSRYVAFTARWIIAEMVRVFYGVALTEAQGIVHACVQFDIPEIWAVAGVKRVMVTGLSARQQAIVLLYSSNGTATADDLIRWIEYGNPSRFVNSVLRQLHEDRLLEYDAVTRNAILSPRGVKEVQKILRM